MSCKCLGCGALIQNSNPNDIGYSKSLEDKYCERCFRIKNYNDYKFVDKDPLDFELIIDKINTTNDLVVLVVDIMSISPSFYELASKIKNDVLLVLSKRDMLSYKISDSKLLSKININCVDKICVSSNKNYNFDELMDKICKHKKSNDVYVVGLTNAGKSTLINKIIYNYTDITDEITTSILPSTTLDSIRIKLMEDLVLIDTPGIIDNSNICNYLSVKDLKKIFPKKEIKPITYQVHGKQFIFIDDLVKIEVLGDCNLTFYFSNQLKIDRMYKDRDCNLVLNNIRCSGNSDIVINGLGFINVKSNVNLNIYTIPNVGVYIRDELI